MIFFLSFFYCTDDAWSTIGKHINRLWGSPQGVDDGFGRLHRPVQGLRRGHATFLLYLGENLNQEKTPRGTFALTDICRNHRNQFFFSCSVVVRRIFQPHEGAVGVLWCSECKYGASLVSRSRISIVVMWALMVPLFQPTSRKIEGMVKFK